MSKAHKSFPITTEISHICNTEYHPDTCLHEEINEKVYNYDMYN